jgi:hypothetical protein
MIKLALPLGLGPARLQCDVMSATRDELHHLVDELAETEVALVLDIVRDRVARQPERKRRLSFAGLLSAEPDLASRSEEILRAKLGDGSG